MTREFSAGGVCVRRFHGRPFVAVIRLKAGTVLALPKGNIDPGETAAETAVREVREETGLRSDLGDKLGTVKYFYVRRGGERVLKLVTFFLLRWKGGSLRDFDPAEVESAEWVPLEDAPQLLSYKGEREMAETALSLLGGGR